MRSDSPRPSSRQERPAAIVDSSTGFKTDFELGSPVVGRPSLRSDTGTGPPNETPRRHPSGLGRRRGVCARPSPASPTKPAAQLTSASASFIPSTRSLTRFGTRFRDGIDTKMSADRIRRSGNSSTSPLRSSPSSPALGRSASPAPARTSPSVAAPLCPSRGPRPPELGGFFRRTGAAAGDLAVSLRRWLSPQATPTERRWRRPRRQHPARHLRRPAWSIESPGRGRTPGSDRSRGM